MSKYLFRILICLLLISCQNENTQKEYYANGNVKQIVKFPLGQDSTTFFAQKFYPNGQMMFQVTFEKGIREGIYTSYSENGKLKEWFNFKKGKRHGVSKYFNTQGEISREYLFLNDKEVIYNQHLFHDSLMLNRIDVINLIDSSKIGMVIYNTEGEIFEEGSFYYNVKGNDSIKQYSESIKKIKFFNKSEKTLFELKLGTLNNKLEFSELYYKNSSNGNVLEFPIDTRENGSNLILGEIALIQERDSVILPFYYQYIVFN